MMSTGAAPEAGKILSNVAWLVSDKVFRLGTNFLLTLWIARHFGPEGFGELSYLLAVVAVLGSFATLGLNTVVVRDLVQQSTPDRVRETLGSATALQAAGGVLAFLIMVAYCLWPLAGIGDTPYPGIILAATLLLQPCAVLRYWFESRLQSRYVVIADNAAFLVSAIAKVLVLLSGGSLVWITAALLIEGAIGAGCLTYLFFTRDSPGPALRASVARVRNLMEDAWPLMLSSLMIILYIRLDQVMLAHISGAASVGLYSAAVRITEIWYLVPGAIAVSMAPRMLSLCAENPDLYRAELERLFRWVLWPTALASMLLWWLANPIVVMVYGETYREAADVLAMYFMTSIFVVFGTIKGSCWVTAMGLQRFGLLSTACGVVSNVALNILLIPLYGGVGAAVATVFSMIISTVVVPLFHPVDRETVWMLLHAFSPKSWQGIGSRTAESGLSSKP